MPILSTSRLSSITTWGKASELAGASPRHRLDVALQEANRCCPKVNAFYFCVRWSVLFEVLRDGSREVGGERPYPGALCVSQPMAGSRSSAFSGGGIRRVAKRLFAIVLGAYHRQGERSWHRGLIGPTRAVISFSGLLGGGLRCRKGEWKTSGRRRKGQPTSENSSRDFARRGVL